MYGMYGHFQSIEPLPDFGRWTLQYGEFNIYLLTFITTGLVARLGVRTSKGLYLLVSTGNLITRLMESFDRFTRNGPYHAP